MAVSQNENQNNTTGLSFYELKDTEFIRISAMLYNFCRIRLSADKKSLVQSRLNKRLRAIGVRNYADYVRLLESDKTGSELTVMVDSLSTNLTFFFREPEHFNYLANVILPKKTDNSEGPFRVWSAGCSSGEEPYTAAIVLREYMKNHIENGAKILATDISTIILEKAKSGVYQHESLKRVPMILRDEYFDKFSDGSKDLFKIKPEIAKLVIFSRMNLAAQWPMKAKFDVVFCRNVMIYFDRDTQTDLVNRFYEVLKPGGILMVGHSESLTGIKSKFKLIKTGFYEKPLV